MKLDLAAASTISCVTCRLGPGKDCSTPRSKIKTSSTRYLAKHGGVLCHKRIIIITKKCCLLPEDISIP